MHLIIDENTLVQTFLAEASYDCFDEAGGLSDKGQVALYRHMENITGIPADQRPSDEEVLALIKERS